MTARLHARLTVFFLLTEGSVSGFLECVGRYLVLRNPSFLKERLLERNFCFRRLRPSSISFS